MTLRSCSTGENQTLAEPDGQKAVLVIDGDEVSTDALTEFAEMGLGLERAKSIADELRGIIDEKNRRANNNSERLSVQIQGSEFPKVEAWLACGAMVGVMPRTEWTREVRNPKSGDLEGYEARVEVIRLSTGAVIAAAEAGCFFDEKLGNTNRLRWTERHAVLSMAGTRATSKALSQPLRWIMVLSGLSGTPMEEMPAKDPRPPANRRPVQSEPNEADQAPDAPGWDDSKPDPKGAPVSAGQLKRLWTLTREKHGEDAEAVLRAVLKRWELTSSKHIQAEDYDAIVSAVENEVIE